MRSEEPAENGSSCASWAASNRKLLWIKEKKKGKNTRGAQRVTGREEQLRLRKDMMQAGPPWGPQGSSPGGRHHNKLFPHNRGPCPAPPRLPFLAKGGGFWSGCLPACWGKGRSPVTHSPPEPQGRRERKSPPTHTP